MRVVLAIFLSISYFTNLSSQEKIKGICWVAGDSINERNISQIKDCNVGWISQTPFAWMSAHDIPEIRFDGDNRHNWGESDFGLIHTAQVAKSQGVKVILKPHIWLHSKGDEWRSDIAMKSKEDWKTWFEQYECMILHYAHVAEEGKMDALCIGTELTQASTKHTQEWRDIIAKIRKIYSGKLTYAGNFYKEYDEIRFWDDLDFIGIQAYFPLTKKKNPTKSELVKGWKKPLKAMHKLSKKYNKPIMFTEIGYKNVVDAAIEPWVWPRQVAEETMEISDETQAICYEAMFEALWDKEWFSGVFIWKWFHGGHTRNSDELFEWISERRKKRYGQDHKQHWIQFTPQGKLAEQVMHKWFARN